ncbi:hypothetical protein [Maribacter cobaltidurans]|uniref:Uncharacterized protein n=1 Tax=Maribacter cobaltidurans TaxID=1178778 RepID=A0A223VAH3_9FLAO|nr:hypothetical protein [Maribacter cobaltidurans]ASV31859.1 hypothetical protein CJ263_17450 [Maribacter cobaltidurans]GGD85136.1 hypothetical protein GCM10011412_23670 [Maribacter cobaltidurans]
MSRIKEKILPQIFIIYTRYLIGGAFVFASLIKIKGHRFTSENGELNPINSAWHFFETMYQSGLYWQFIGITQLIAGFFLMTQKFSKLGALINLPIILNIFIITLSYYFAYTPVITGLMLSANLLLIIWEWNELKILFNLNPNFNKNVRLEKDVLWQIVGLILFVFTFIYRALIDKYNLGFWMLTCFSIGFIGLMIGLYREKKRKNYLQHSV